MSHRRSNAVKRVLRMDPSCAICFAQPPVECDCEARRLDLAVQQAEERVMTHQYSKIRKWVRSQAQDYVLELFRKRSETTKSLHSDELDRIRAMSYSTYNRSPHPWQYEEAQKSFRRGIDEDWQMSVQKYPEVLDYFFSHVKIDYTLPSDPAANNPAYGGRKAGRQGSEVDGMNGVGGASSSRRARERHASRTPPPGGRRTPGRDRRGSSHRQSIIYLHPGY